MSRPGFRTFNPALKRFFAATVINMIGTAALFGFVLIYFHEVRHIPLGQAGLAVGCMSFTMVVLTPVGGFLSDHFGARRMLAIGCVLSIVGAAAYSFVDRFATAAAVSVLMGVANALWYPSQSALMALIVSPAERPAVSAFQRGAMNLGAALGGVLGGVMVRSGTLASFRWLFVVNALTYVVFLSALPALPPGRVPVEQRRAKGEGFAVVLRDSFFVRLLFTDLGIALGFGFLWGFMPIYASTIGISKTMIGVLFTFGAASVVVTQIPTLGWVHGGRRMVWLAVMNLWFSAAFVLMLTTPHIAVGAAAVVIGVSQMLGGFGEAILGVVRNPLTSDIAPPELIGRYFGLQTMVFQVCMGLANAIGGVVMQHSLSVVWLIPLAATLAGAAGSMALRHRVPERAAISA